MKGRAGLREGIARSFTIVEDVVYVVLGLLLAGSLAALLLDAGLAFARSFSTGLAVLTAELGELARRGGEAFRAGLIETALITGVILALAGALVVLRKRHPQAVVERA